MTGLCGAGRPRVWRSHKGSVPTTVRTQSSAVKPKAHHVRASATYLCWGRFQASRDCSMSVAAVGSTRSDGMPPPSSSYQSVSATDPVFVIAGSRSSCTRSTDAGPNALWPLTQPAPIDRVNRGIAWQVVDNGGAGCGHRRWRCLPRGPRIDIPGRRDEKPRMPSECGSHVPAHDRSPEFIGNTI